MAFLFIMPESRMDVWQQAMKKIAPELDLRCYPDQVGNVADIRHVGAWMPPAGVIQKFPALEVIFSLGAGVDALLIDPTLPHHVPLVRVSEPDLTQRMSEYIVLQVLMHHRKQYLYTEQQNKKIWQAHSVPTAGEVRVGILGLGALGLNAAYKLKAMGYEVVGWRRTAQAAPTNSTAPDISCYSGPEGLNDFLAQTQILVCLLPATPETEGILNRPLFEKLAHKPSFGAPAVINAGRGRLQVATDILDSLDQGILSAVSLDVFATEPLPADDPFWTHPRVIMTPHCAAESDPFYICQYIYNQLNAYAQGQPLQNLVDRSRGY